MHLMFFFTDQGGRGTRNRLHKQRRQLPSHTEEDHMHMQNLGRRVRAEYQTICIEPARNEPYFLFPHWKDLYTERAFILSHTTFNR